MSANHAGQSCFFDGSACFNLLVFITNRKINKEKPSGKKLGRLNQAESSHFLLMAVKTIGGFHEEFVAKVSKWEWIF